MAAALAGAGNAWELSDRSATAPSLRLGAHRLPIEEIVDWRAERQADYDRRGSLLIFAVFGAGGLLFLNGVLEFGLRQRFLAGAVLLGLIALSAVIEAFRMTRIDFYRLHVTTVSGKTVSFATANPDEMQALITAVHGRLGKRVRPPAETRAAPRAGRLPAVERRSWRRRRRRSADRAAEQTAAAERHAALQPDVRENFAQLHDLGHDRDRGFETRGFQTLLHDVVADAHEERHDMRLRADVKARETGSTGLRLDLGDHPPSDTRVGEDRRDGDGADLSP